MAQTITSLLTESASASIAGDTRRGWELINNYAQYFWLEDESDISPDQLGDFYSVRAAAADWMGLEDEAISALQRLQAWARERGNHEAALVAGAHLAYQSLNQSEHSVYPLPDASILLADVAEKMRLWRPDAESLTIDEDPELSWRTVSKRQAGMLTAAATTAHTVATNVLNASPADADSSVSGTSQSDSSGIKPDALVQFFASIVRKFGRNPANRADELLWYSQERWAAGQLTEARKFANEVLEVTNSAVAHFEAHYMLGHFAMLDNLNVGITETERALAGAEPPEAAPSVLESYDESALAIAEENDRAIADHWTQCATIAREIGAPVMALERAELACRTLSTLGREGDAWALASAMIDATDGIPVCPALLDMRAMLAQAAFMSGLHAEAWDNARAVAEWSEFSPDIERTIACYTIATFAGLELGYDKEVLDLQQRRAELYKQVGQGVNASHVLQTLAMREGINHEQAQQLMQEARELLNDSSATELPESEKLWNVGEWHLAMSQIVNNEMELIEQSQLAARNFHLAADPLKECMAWLNMAGGHLALGNVTAADESITKATATLPDLQEWMDDTETDFDPVVLELIDHYRYILEFRQGH